MKNWQTNLITLLGFASLELICFFPLLKQAGFYLDDWSMLCNLHIGPKSFIDLSNFLFTDNKIIIRPLESPYFALLYQIFSEKPLGYHLANAAFEIFSAWFFYLSVARLSKDKAFACVLGLLFLLIPLHDATRYWMTASSVTFSMTLYLWSLYLNIDAIERRNYSTLGFSVLLFVLSVYNYESFMPLFGINVLCALYLFFRQQRSERLQTTTAETSGQETANQTATEAASLGSKKKLKETLIATAIYELPFFLTCISMYVYQRVVLTSMKIGYTRTIAFSINNALATLYEAFRINFSTHTISFFTDRVKDALTDLNSTKLIVLFVEILAITAVLAMVNAKAKDDVNSAKEGKSTSDTESGARKASLLFTFILGFLIIPMSFAIYCIVPGYLPGLDSTLNRINTGACLGVCLMLATAIVAISRLAKREVISISVSTILATLILFYFQLTNIGYAKPWIASAKVQHQVMQDLMLRKKDVPEDASIILAGVPRYVMWAPVFDGVWDFQQMLRMLYDNQKIKATVVCDRLAIKKGQLQDISCDYVCGTYPFSSMYIYAPNPPIWEKIESPQSFIDVIDRKGRAFDITDKLISNWKDQAKLD